MTVYSHFGRHHVRYYTKDGTYQDHGRMIYDKTPQPGDFIHPFCGAVDGKGMHSNWRVTEVKIPENDSCIEIYYEDLGYVPMPPCSQ